MKSKTFMSLTAVLLSLLLLAGCGSAGAPQAQTQPQAQPQTQTESQPQDQSQPAAQIDTIAPISYEGEVGYQTQYLEIGDKNLTASLENGTVFGDSIFFTSLGVVSDNTPEGVTPEWEGQYSVYGPVLLKVGIDGSAERIPYIPQSLSEESNGSGGVTYERICPAGEGALWLLERHYRSWNETPEETSPDDAENAEYTRSEESYSLVCIAEDGTVKTELPLEELRSHSELTDQAGTYSFTVRGMVYDGDGHILLALDEWYSGNGTYSEENRICIMDAETGAIQDNVVMNSVPESMALLADGQIAVSYFAAASQRIGLFDIKTKTMNDGAVVDDFINGMTAGGGAWPLYYSAGDSFYGITLPDGEVKKLLNWIDCDVARSGDESICVMNDGRIVTTASSETSNGVKNELVVLTPVPLEQFPERKVLTMAVYNLHPFTSAMITRFNRNNPDYHIEVTDYAQYDDYTSDNKEDWRAGINRLQTEIIAGNIPDILDISLLSADRLGTKGILEDLYAYIDADPEFGRSDLQEHVLAAFEENGKLYQTVSNFYILTTAGLSSVVGDRIGWNMAEFNAAYQQLQAVNPHATVFDVYTTRSDVLTFLLYLEMENFVDWEKGECGFEGQSFLDFLSFVKSFPSTFDWASAELTEADLDQDTRLLMGAQMMKQCNFACFEDVQTNTAGLNGAPCTFVGYPTQNGVGSMFAQIGNSFAITSGCSDKAAAWEFVRLFFLPDYQVQLGGNIFATNKAVYEEVKKAAQSPLYERNPDGSYVLDAEGKRVEAERDSIQVSGHTYTYHTVTAEEIALVEELIAATNNILHTDNSLRAIIEEGAAPFFADQRSLEETARQIQSRANLYVNEQR